jgi:cation diffusion facilitator CzcD-associated flavoprotein CzcO
METTDIEIAVLGAGPYGLSAAAHMKAAGRDVQVIGRTMSFWREQMPVGMLLRSPYVACNLSDPDGVLTLADYERAKGMETAIPVPLDRFVDYGTWFREQAGLDVDERHVASVSRNGTFALELDDGETLTARRVVVAAGIGPFANRPHLYGALPEDRVSHACEEIDIARFSGRRVAVIGGGQSALESAALLHEHGADVEVIVRQGSVHWLNFRLQHELGLLSRLLYAPPDVGPAGISHLVARPSLYRWLPRRTQTALWPRVLRPAGAGWLVPRMRDTVLITTGRAVTRAEAEGDAVRLTLDDGSVRSVDHVLLGTGYRVDVGKYPFLSRGLLEAVRRVDGHPTLSHGLESSVDGLHFLGAPAARSFGPLLRFVAGADFAARAVARKLASIRAPAP